MRRQPVAFFLGDAAFLSDSKFRQLARRLTDPDDFNSAVGAYFIALAAARRNGLPELDLDSETGSRFLPDLIEVGLLVAEGFPDKAFGSWAPSRPKYPSDSKNPAATDVPSVPSATDTPFTPAREPSLPLTSIPISSSTGGGPGEGLPNLNSTVAAIWLEVSGQSVIGSGQFAQDYLDDACRRHPAYEVGAAIYRARKAFDHIPAAQPLAAEVRRILDPFVDPKAAAAAEREQELARVRRRGVEDTIRNAHTTGFHEKQPDARCSICQAQGVTA